MNNIVKTEKNYFRINIKELITSTNGKALLLTAKYKHNDYNKWITFTTVRSYIPGFRSYTLCNHINILKTDIDTQRVMLSLSKIPGGPVIARGKHYLPS